VSVKFVGSLTRDQAWNGKNVCPCLFSLAQAFTPVERRQKISFPFPFSTL
jgi:hypothetical protein